MQTFLFKRINKTINLVAVENNCHNFECTCFLVSKLKWVDNNNDPNHCRLPGSPVCSDALVPL